MYICTYVITYVYKKNETKNKLKKTEITFEISNNILYICKLIYEYTYV